MSIYHWLGEIRIFKVEEPLCQITRRHITEDDNNHSHYRLNIKYNKIFLIKFYYYI